LSDPACDANTQIRLANAATRARAAMTVMLDASKVEEPLPTLQQLLGEQHA
jgi:hypothetical protein